MLHDAPKLIFHSPSSIRDISYFLKKAHDRRFQEKYKAKKSRSAQTTGNLYYSYTHNDTDNPTWYYFAYIFCVVLYLCDFYFVKLWGIAFPWPFPWTYYYLAFKVLLPCFQVSSFKFHFKFGYCIIVELLVPGSYFSLKFCMLDLILYFSYLWLFVLGQTLHLKMGVDWVFQTRPKNWPSGWTFQTNHYHEIMLPKFPALTLLKISSALLWEFLLLINWKRPPPLNDSTGPIRY